MLGLMWLGKERAKRSQRSGAGLDDDDCDAS